MKMQTDTFLWAIQEYVILNFIKLVINFRLVINFILIVLVLNHHNANEERSLKIMFATKTSTFPCTKLMDPLLQLSVFDSYHSGVGNGEAGGTKLKVPGPPIEGDPNTYVPFFI